MKGWAKKSQLKSVELSLESSFAVVSCYSTHSSLLQCVWITQVSKTNPILLVIRNLNFPTSYFKTYYSSKASVNMSGCERELLKSALNWLRMVFLLRCYVSSNRDHAARKFWWLLNTASFSLCFIPVLGNQVWIYGKLTTLRMIHKASVSKCHGAVSWALSLEYILFPLSLPGKNKYSLFFFFIIIATAEERKNRQQNTKAIK